MSAAQAACLRCRSRKTKCLGRADDSPCKSCDLADEECLVVPHKRGRKVGTRLSAEVRRRLRRRHSALNQVASESSKSEYVDAGSDLHPKSSMSAAIPAPPLQRSYTAAITQMVPTSSIRVSSKTHADIGPSTQRTSSIAKLFTPKRTEGLNKRHNLASYREDPITCGYIDEAAGRQLFNLFMGKLSCRLFMFDEHLHTYEYVRNTSAFLFCVMLAVAAKYDTGISPVIHQKCLALAKDQMLKAFANDVKTEETVQALFVLTEYKEAEDENGYLLLGMIYRPGESARPAWKVSQLVSLTGSSRIAVEMDLSCPRDEHDERRKRNRERIWLILFAADRRYNYCGQTAKPSMMPEDALVRSSEQWVESPLCLTADHRLANNVILRRLLAAHIEAIDRDNESGPGRFHLDVRDEYRKMEQEADRWAASQTERDPETLVHAILSSLHAKVIIAHRWVQRSFRTADSFADGEGAVDEAQDRERREALAVCINGSIGVLNTMLQLPDDALRYACDSKHLYFAYASFFLHKVFDTGIAAMMLDRQSLSYMYNLFQRCAEQLERLTLLQTHTIAFHARFLRLLMEQCTVISSNNDTQVEQAAVAVPDVPSGHGAIGTLPSSNPGQVSQYNEPLMDSQPETDWSAVFGTLEDFRAIPPVGDRLLGPAEDSVNLNLSWNDYWPFDDLFWPADNNAGVNGQTHDWENLVQSFQ
ncbi:hypothetical protein IAT40_002846 [Kwoniella sp. CBS 6097]